MSPFSDSGPGPIACETTSRPVFRPPSEPPARMNIGCGPCCTPGWFNADRHPGQGIDLECDIRRGVKETITGLPWVLRRRRVIAPEVEAQLRRLEA